MRKLILSLLFALPLAAQTPPHSLATGTTQITATGTPTVSDTEVMEIECVTP